MGELINELVTEIFVKQPLALPGSAKYRYIFDVFLLFFLINPGVRFKGTF